VDVGNNMNFMKVNNKLIGTIENADLYNSDDNFLKDDNDFAAAHNNNVDRNQQLDLGLEERGSGEGSKGADNKFLMKMKTRKLEKDSGSIEQQVINLGFVQAMATKLSANQLAANGIQLSMRENLINFIKDMDKDKITQKEKNLLTMLQNSQQEDVAEGDVKMQSDKQTSSAPPINENSMKIVSSVPPQESQEDEETGLLFYDPLEEARAKKEKEMIENLRNRQNLKRDANNASSGIVSSITAQSSLLNRKPNQRLNFITQLRNTQKARNVMTLDKVKSTFQATELDQDVGSKRKSKNKDDGLIEDRDSDSDFSEGKAKAEQRQSAKVWDDEENYIGDEDEEREEALDEEAESAMEEGTEEKMGVEDFMAASSKMSDAGESEIGTRKRRQVKRSANSSQASHVAKKNKIKKKKQLAGFFDEEAELGSDDEQNDDINKQINKDDVEENEEGLDEDLEGFVVKGDQQEIGEADEDMMEKFRQDLEADDRARIRQVTMAVLYGQNKKRMRGEVEGLDDDADDFERRKQERLEEREKQMNS
jgi:hypothetical protein